MCFFVYYILNNCIYLYTCNILSNSSCSYSSIFWLTFPSVAKFCYIFNQVFVAFQTILVFRIERLAAILFKLISSLAFAQAKGLCDFQPQAQEKGNVSFSCASSCAYFTHVHMDFPVLMLVLIRLFHKCEHL